MKASRFVGPAGASAVLFAACAAALLGVVLPTGCTAGSPGTTGSTPPVTNLVLAIPEAVENGASVPATINVAPSLEPGEALFLMQGHEPIAVVRLEGDVAVNKVGLRIRLLRSGTLVAILQRGKELVAGARQHVEVGTPAVIPEDNRAETKVRTRINQGALQVAVHNDSALNGYIRRVTVAMDGGMVHIFGSPLLAKDPFFLIRPDFLAPNPSVSVELSSEPRRGKP